MGAVKPTVEYTRYISVQDIKDMDNGSTYLLKWHDDSIAVKKSMNHIVLSYKMNDEHIRTTVMLDTTKVGYGMRLWFNCPACSNRTAKLYNVGGIFSCRDCHNLVYLTSKKSGKKLEYLSLKIRRLQMQLGIDISRIDCDIQETPIYKPKYMHQKTFDLLKQKLEIIQIHWLDEWLKQVM